MTTGTAREFTARLLEEKPLMRTRKFLILGLNRTNPGFGDDAVLVERQTGLWQPLSGEFRQGVRVSKSEIYRTTCNEYRENGWTNGNEDEEDEWEPEDDPYREPNDENSDDEGQLSTVIVPEDAKFMTPGTKLEVSYCCDDGSFESVTAWKSDSYCFDIIEAPYGLSFHANRTMDGILLDEDFFNFPLVCWNTGSLPIKSDGKKIPVGAYLILSPNDPKRKKRRLYYNDIMSVPIWDSEAGIAKNEKLLLAMGCPSEDAHLLAAYFWRNAIYGVEDYMLSDHSFWMNEVRREGRPRLQS